MTATLHQMTPIPVSIPEVTPPPTLTSAQKAEMIDAITVLLQKRSAVLVAHYYVDAELQKLALRTGGCVADSLEMARFGSRSDAEVIVVAGVRFMAETAKILTPHKRVLSVSPQAECSLDIGCPYDAFAAFCDDHPSREVVVYANTSAAVKARADWVVTSSTAVSLVQRLDEAGIPIVWAPDKYLGQYVADQTGADMILWDGACVVHEGFKAEGLAQLRAAYPHAKVLVHPESPPAVIAQADVVGSTKQMLDAAIRLDADTFIVATDRGLLFSMRQAAPDKTFLEAPNAGVGATCKSCAHCPWMAMNGLPQLLDALRHDNGEVTLDSAVIDAASRSIKRLLTFAETNDIAAARQV